MGRIKLFEGWLWVVGEGSIGKIFLPRSGHRPFTTKDKKPFTTKGTKSRKEGLFKNFLFHACGRV